MPITIDFTHTAPAFDWEEVLSWSKRVAGVHGELAAARKAGRLPFYDLPRQDLSGLLRYARDNRGRFRNLVVLGIGGSALGLIALDAALRSPYRWAAPPPAAAPGIPQLYVLDNIDPERTDTLLSALDPGETLVNVITKSGDTAETMASFLVFRQWLIDALGEEGYRGHAVVTTSASHGALRRIADQERLESFDIPEGVGGRFSVLTPVGLLPAALAGIDIEALLAGAEAMDRRLADGALEKNPAYLAAVLHVLGYGQGRKISVMFAYSDRLYGLADWYRQLWAESLGKRTGLEGEVVRVGPTPIKALGVTDQHSQVQLYREGPDDKIYTFLKTQDYPRPVPIPAAFGGDESVSYLGGHSLGELFQAEEQATEAALAMEGRPVTAITFPRIGAAEVGEFFHFFEVVTVAAGALLRINPLDQPGVEEGKNFAYGLLGRPGYEHKRKEFDSYQAAGRRRLFG